MSKNLWEQHHGNIHMTMLHETAWRLVEAQHLTATRKLVDSLEEQAILEELIDASKPTLAHALMKLHPLLSTPFRYPPLKHGSRFGSRFEMGIWYGSKNINTSFAEKAYYTLSFINASEADYGMVEFPLTAFSTQIKTNKGIDLTKQPFDRDAGVISAPDTYERSQSLGAAMREAGVVAFNYQSARDKERGTNTAVISPAGFLYKKPDSQSFQTWQCMATRRLIEFTRSSALAAQSSSFPIDLFLVSGKLPTPAL